MRVKNSSVSRNTSTYSITSAKIKHVSDLNPPRKENRVTINNYSQERRLPTHLPNGIFEAKLLADLQNRIPSVVVYCWNLNNGDKRESACLSYVNNYKRNEKILSLWGVTSYVLICYDQASLSAYSQPTDIEASIKSSVPQNKFFFRSPGELETVLIDGK